jgi:hypothetical protein
MPLKFGRHLIGLICLVLGNATWSQAAQPLPASDEPLDAGFESFYFVKQQNVADRTNAAVGLAGITAPKGGDIFSFGRAEIDQAKKDLTAKMQDDISSAFFGKPAPVPSKKKETAGSLRFQASDTELGCLQALSTSSAIRPHSECTSTKVIQALWSKNALLLARYHSISQLPHFRGDFTSNGQLLLDMSKLIAADIYLEVERGNFETAYRKWKANHQFVRLLKGVEVGLVGKAIFSIAEAFSLYSVELILSSDKRVAVKYADELLQLLKPKGIAYWNVPAIVRAEYFITEPLIKAWGDYGQPANFLHNGFFRSAKALVAASQAHPSIAGDRIERVQAAYVYQGKPPDAKADLTNPAHRAKLHQFMLARFISPQLNGAKELVQVFHLREERMRMLSLAVMIAQKSIPDKNVSSFFASVDPAYKSAFTDKPFDWVADQRLIRFVDPKGKSSFDVRL